MSPRHKSNQKGDRPIPTTLSIITYFHCRTPFEEILKQHQIKKEEGEG